MYYWVNQGKTYKEEKAGGYLWAPLSNKLGKSVFHWDTMANLMINDIVFNYCKGYVVGYSVVKSLSYKTEKPEEFNSGVLWDDAGRMCDVEYNEFENKLSLEHISNILNELPAPKYSPIGITSKVNQGYLYEIGDDWGNAILKEAKVNSLKLFEVTTVNNEKYELQNDVPDVTSRRGLVTSRVGQGAYRRKLLLRWNNKCAITGCEIPEILIASHIKPWSESNNKERLDVDNGILLSPLFDALFDRHLISFTNSGDIIVSNKLTKFNLRGFNITGEEKISGLNEGNKMYLEEHRKKLK